LPGPDENGAVSKHIRFLPFMMITPYVIGRLMRLPDLDLFARIILLAGLALLPLLILDRLTATGRAWRWPIFGLDHGPLLVGALLAALLLALCEQVLDWRKAGEEYLAKRRLILLGLIGLVTVLLVWVMARGWTLAGLTGVAIMSLSMRTCLLALRAGLFAYVVVIAALALVFLPASSFYSLILSAPAPAPAPVTEFCPILGEASCQPFRDGVDSVAIRWVMYREAVAMFMDNPVWGVGAARFGDCSCTGPGWYPHNLILHGFAELGLIGGGLLLGLLMLATWSLTRPLMSARQEESQTTHAFVLALLALFLVADQFYGSYFMAAGAWLMFGIAASQRAHAGKEEARLG
jgi:O-antigen ligase